MPLEFDRDGTTPCMFDSLYTDGGVIGRNPSLQGGTWAFVAVDSTDHLIFERSGVILPSDIGMETVENNIAETIAILLALECCPVGWYGSVYCDNLNSVRRAREPKAIKKVVPKFIKDRMIAACGRVEANFVLLGGHPTKADLARGFREDGAEVSRWNVRADALCNEAKDRLASRSPS